MKRFALLLVVLFAVQLQQAYSQNDRNAVAFGFEGQWYPAGYQLMLTSEIGLTKKDAINIKAGYNIAQRQDFSPYNDLENGGGFGATLGYRRYWKSNLRGLYAGVRTDLWQLSIDWEDNINTPSPSAGTTNITVLQPTAEIGYMYQLENSPISVGVNAAAGYEINVVTDGDEVGQGAIGLFGLRIRFRIK